MTDKITARLENWQLVFNNLYGDIYDDSKNRFEDGKWIKLSKINAVELKEGDIIQTMNSKYLLGKEGK